MNASLRALNRFGLGARLGEAASISDPREWLHAQITAPLRDTENVVLPKLSEAEEANRALLQGQAAEDPEAIRVALQRVAQIRQAETSALLSKRVTTETPLLERLVAFWSNHLCISIAGKQRLAVLAGLYEREAIRPHVLGKFSEMVLASARHPAMLGYLDNALSIGPNSRGALTADLRGGRERGLNENYARELLELHTVGIEGGYTQTDVIEVAKAFTGWSVAGVGSGALGRRAEEDGFLFRPALHEPGPKTVLGKRYAERGEREGEEIIRDLCLLPATARFISRKLVAHFVDDAPPPTAVNRIASVFLETEGDLSEIAHALIDLEEAWEPVHKKFRTPQDWIVAALRAIRASEVPPLLVQALTQLRHPLWGPASPKGFGDAIGDWADPDSLLNRAELARTLAGRTRRARISPPQLLEVVEVTSDHPLSTLLSDTSIPAEERIALVIGGPVFQWR